MREIVRGLAFALAAAAPVAAAPVQVQAATIGFTLYVTGSTVALQNESDGAGITGMSLTIGDVDYDYDDNLASFAIGGAGSSFTLISPDDIDGGVRSDVLEFSFAGFDPGDRFEVANDIDPDSGDSPCCNASGVLLNNGDAANAELTVTFSNGYQLSYVVTDTDELPDPDGFQCQTFGDCAFTASFEVPEPGFFLLVGTALLALSARALLQLL